MFSEIRWSLLDRGQLFAGRKPRLHDLRHSFSVATILRWHAEGEDVNAMMPYLSAYLGNHELAIITTFPPMPPRPAPRREKVVITL